MSEKKENLKRGMGQEPKGSVPLPSQDKTYSKGDEPGGRAPTPKPQDNKSENGGKK